MQYLDSNPADALVMAAIILGVIGVIYVLNKCGIIDDPNDDWDPEM